MMFQHVYSLQKHQLLILLHVHLEVRQNHHPLQSNRKFHEVRGVEINDDGTKLFLLFSNEHVSSANEDVGAHLYEYTLTLHTMYQHYHLRKMLGLSCLTIYLVQIPTGNEILRMEKFL